MNIKVGDAIYFEQYGRLVSRQEVERITPSGIIRTKSYNLRQHGDDGWLHITGQDGWRSASARLATPALDEQWRNRVATDWLEKNYNRIKAEDIEPLMKKYAEEAKS